MSEWIDFSIYAASNIVLWVMLPLAYRELALPVMMDRNPEWVAANPEAVRRIARSYWFNNSCIAWGIFAVTTLLLIQLGVHIPGVKQSLPLWQQLGNINSLLFAAGFVCFAVVMAFVQFRLHRWIPRGVRRSASLQPRTTADLVPLSWRVATEILTAGLFITWIIVGMLGIATSPKFWGGFIFLFANSLIFAVMGHVSAWRPPNYMDRIYGPVYRRREVRILYGVRLAFVAFGAIALTGNVLGPAAMPADPVRLSLLLFQIIFVSFILAFVLIKPATNPAAPAAPGGKSMRFPELTISLIMLIVVPIIVAAATSASTPATCCAASTPSFHVPRAAVSSGPQWVGRWLR